MIETAILCAAMAVLFAMSAIFSASETVLFSLTPVSRRRIGAKKPKIAVKIEAWLKAPEKPLATILAGNTIVNFALVSVGYVFLKRHWPEWAEAVTVPLFTLLLLVFGEIGPKQFAMRHAERLAPGCARILGVWMVVLRPFSKPMVAAHGVFGDLVTRERKNMSDAEFKVVVRSAAKSGILDNEEVDMVEGVMRLSDLYAMNEMTPRVRLEGVSADATLSQMAEISSGVDHPFLPVYRADMDHIEGFYEKKTGKIVPAMRVKENDGLDDLLIAFVKSGKRIAVVEDRWGGTAGVITRGDILEIMVRPVEVEEDEISRKGAA